MSEKHCFIGRRKGGFVKGCLWQMCPRSGFRSRGTCERTLVPVFVLGEHPNVPLFRFSFWENIRQNHPFGKPPFCQPLNRIFSVCTGTRLSSAIWSCFNLAHQNRTIAIASDFRVDGAKSPEILHKEEVLGSEIAARNRKSLATFHRTLKSQCSIALSCLGNRAISGVRDGHRNRKSQKSLRFRCAKCFNEEWDVALVTVRLPVRHWQPDANTPPFRYLPEHACRQNTPPARSCQLAANVRAKETSNKLSPMKKIDLPVA